MTNPRNINISPRKAPKQARSTVLVAIVLQAAVQVLTKEGATRFTMARVAEKAGVSVGSLYQYFPNKAAILFRLQCDEWQQTTNLLRTILEDGRDPPLQRVRRLVPAFIRSECEEAAMRVALGDAAPLYRDAPETKKARASAQRALQHFMHEALPQASEATRRQAASLLTSTLGSVGKQFSETARTARQIDTFSSALADMFCAYLKDLASPNRPASAS